jgi:ATP-dependent DNA helicase RecG
MGAPGRLYDTMSSFSNQDDGGIIVFGLSEDKAFDVVGVYNAQDLQKKVGEQCMEMEPPIRALFTVCEISGRFVVSAEIPPVDISERPVYYKGAGRVKGSYVRVGEADERMSEYEIYSFDAYRKRVQDDRKIVPEARLSLFNVERLEDYMKSVKDNRENLRINVSDEDILELMGVTSEGVPTVAGVLSFSKYPQGYFPQLCVTAVTIPGNDMGDIGDEGERFIDNKRITGAIPEMLESAVDYIRKNSRIKTIVSEDGRRRDRAEYPVKAIREAVLNALVHRDYSVHTMNVPIRIEMYRNRIEIINSGGLYGKISIDSLGKVHPDTRNAVLCNILELLYVTENRYSGIPTIRAECRAAGLPAPIFSVIRGEFRVTFRNNIDGEGLKRNRETLMGELLDFCSTPRSREEIVEFVGCSRQYAMTNYVQPLLESKQLRMTIPAKPKRSKQKYLINR